MCMSRFFESTKDQKKRETEYFQMIRDEVKEEFQFMDPQELKNKYGDINEDERVDMEFRERTKVDVDKKI